MRVGDPDGAGPARPQRLYGQAVPEQLVVGGRQRVEEQPLAGGVLAQPVAEQGEFGRLVDGDPHVHAVPEPLGDGVRVRGEAVRRVPYEPAAALLQRQRRVPVEERRHGPYARRAQFVDEPVVEVQAGLVDGAAAVGVDAGPGEGEAVRADAEPRQQGDVLAVAVVVVAGDRGVAAVLDPAGLGGEDVPGGGRPAGFARSALDLLRGGGHAPQEVLREVRKRPWRRC